MKPLRLRLFWGLVLMLLCISSASAQNYYNRYYGTVNNDQFRDLSINLDGSMYVAGRMNGVASLSLLDDCGNLIWTREYSAIGASRFLSMVAAEGGGLLLAYPSGGDWYVTRVDAAGNVLWWNRYGTGNERSIFLEKAQGDNYFVAGWFAPSGISDDMTIMKIDGGGGVTLTKRYHLTDDQTYDVISNGGGGLVLTGGLHGGGVDMFILEVDTDADLINFIEYEQTVGNRSYENRSITRTADGGYAILGQASVSGANLDWTVIVIAKLDAGFNKLWQKDFVNSANGAFGIQEGDNGHLYALMRTNWNAGNVNPTILELESATGDLVQAKAYPDFTYGLLRPNQPAIGRLVMIGANATGTFGNGDARLNVLPLDLSDCEGVDVDPVATDVNIVPLGTNVSGPFNLGFSPTAIASNEVAGQPGENEFCGGCVTVPPAANNNYNRIYGTANSDVFRDYSLNVDGSMYVTGRMNGKGSLTLVDPCGEIIWTKEYTASGLTIFGSMIKATGGDLLMSYRLNDDWYITRVDGNGNVLWAKRYDNTRERSFWLEKSIGDTYFAAGWFAQFGVSDDATILKIDGAGNEIFTKRLNQIDDQTYDIISNGNGGLVLTGGIHGNGVDMFLAEIDDSGTVLNAREYEKTSNHAYENMSITRTSDGGYAILGRASNSFSAIYTNNVVMKLNSNFDREWEVDFVVNNIGGYSIQEANNDHLYVMARTDWAGGSDYTIIEMETATGDVIRAKAYPDYDFAALRPNEQAIDHLVVFGNQNTGTYGSDDARLSILPLNLDDCEGLLVDPVTTSLEINPKNWTPGESTVDFEETDVAIQDDLASTTCDYICGACCPTIEVEVEEDCIVLYPGIDFLSSATLSVSGASGGAGNITYEWSTGETGPSINISFNGQLMQQQIIQVDPITGNAFTTYTVTCTDANGCTGSATIIVWLIDVIDHNHPGNNTMVFICHNGSTQTVNVNSLNAHLAHGDFLGDCQDDAIDPCTGLPKSMFIQGVQDHGKRKHDAPASLQVRPNVTDGHAVEVVFTLPEHERASLEVFDMTGKKVADVSSVTGSGMQQIISFDTEQLNSGMYLVRMTSSHQALTSRLIVNK